MSVREICLDANILLSAFVDSEGSHAAALEVLDWVEKNSVPLYEPALVVFEFSSVLHRKRLEGLIGQREMEQILDFFFQLPLLLQWQSSLIKKTLQSARHLSLRRAYDCSYLAVAIGRDIPLVTEDQELLKKGRRLHRHIYSLDDFLRLSR